MISVAGGRHELEVQYRVRETGLYGETPFVDEWKPPPSGYLHLTAVVIRAVKLTPFAIGAEEVTNAQYEAFMRASGYAPRRPERFLAHWTGGVPAADDRDRAVTYVDLDGARAYAVWAGFRFPTEDEWQVAATFGAVHRLQPEVWNLTESEHTDGRTRFVILKGGSTFYNTGSVWYFDGGVQQPTVSAKLVTLAGGLVRSSSIGFKCAVDIARPR